MSATVIISVAALVVSMASIATAVWSAWYSQRSTAKRELLNWRRQELLRAASELAQLSSHRQAVLVQALDALMPPRSSGRWVDPFNTAATGGPHPRHSIDQMSVIAERMGLLDEPLAAVARKIVKAHRWAMSAADDAYPSEGEYDVHLDTMVVDGDELETLHTELMEAFRRSVGLAGT